MALLILCKLILQTYMRGHPEGLDIWFLVRPFAYFHTSCVGTAMTLIKLRRLAWAFAGRLYDKYHNLMSWLKCCLERKDLQGKRFFYPHWTVMYFLMLPWKNIAVFSETTDVPQLPNQPMVAISVMKPWPWKLGQSHQNLIRYWSYLIYIGLQIW